MSSQQYIYDDGDLRKYRTEIPNMADDELDPFQYRLYAHYKRVGQCWESVRTTADKCKMSATKMIECRNWLHENGWIAVEHRDNTTCLVTVLDRWGENFLRFANHTVQDSVPNMEHPVPNMEHPVPNMESKKEPIKKEPIKNGEGTPPAQLGKRRQRQTPEHMRIASMFGMEPKEMTHLVDVVLRSVDKVEIASLENDTGGRELSYAQECAISLVQVGISDPEQIENGLALFHSEWNEDATPSYRQLLDACVRAKKSGYRHRGRRVMPIDGKRNSDGSITTAFVPPLPAYAA